MDSLSFEEKVQKAKERGVLVRQDRSDFLWFCPDHCWRGYYNTEEAAWKASFQWCGFDPIEEKPPKPKDPEPLTYRAPFIPLMRK